MPIDPHDPSNTPQIVSEIQAAKTVMLNALAEHCRNSPTLFAQDDRRALFISTILSATSVLCTYDPHYHTALHIIYMTKDLPLSEGGQKEVDELAALYASL